jgi:hypothetical protein
MSIDPSTFLSGDTGDVTDPWRVAKRRAGEVTYEALDLAIGTRRRAARLAANTRPLEVLVLGIYRLGSLMPAALPALRSTRHRVTIALGSLPDQPDDGLAGVTVASGLEGGKFENLNALLAQSPPSGARWVIVIDDDVGLPRGFLDRFLLVCERIGLQLAQPALTHASHAAWRVFRRRRWSVARTTHMVEIGPLTAFSAPVAAQLLPFPPLRMGWGLDAHWGALAVERGWRLGVVDATPIRHSSRVTASAYDREGALAELQEFLRDRSWIDRNTANSVIETYTNW